MAMIVAVVLGAGAVGGGLYYALKTGKLTLPGGSMVPKVEAQEKEPPKTHGLVMEPILVNLQDPGGRAYLRVGITLRVLDDEPAKGAKAKEEKPAEKGPKPPTEAETSARDVILTVLGQQTSDDLLEADGKEALKAKLRAGLKEHDPDLKVTELFYTEFLVQR
jgi:flagellar FliL protein